MGMENEFMKRGYLLPDGCKDLSDVANLKQRRASDPSALGLLAPKKFVPLPPITKQVFIPPQTTVKKLAALLDLKPFEIVGDLMKLGVFPMTDFLLDFKTISEVARMHGFLAIKAGL
jgi:hypothetical protein